MDDYLIADPTWDNFLDHDYYNHFAMTPEEENETARYKWLSWENELFDIHSLEDFYRKIDFLLNRESNNLTLDQILKNLLYKLEKLDFNKYQALKDRFFKIDLESRVLTILDSKQLVKEIGLYLVEHVNHSISGTTLIDAVVNMKQKVESLSTEECSVLRKQLIQENAKRQAQKFPHRQQISEQEIVFLPNQVASRFDIYQADKVALNDVEVFMDQTSGLEQKSRK